jgi:hypothetical protein
MFANHANPPARASQRARNVRFLPKMTVERPKSTCLSPQTGRPQWFGPETASPIAVSI